MGRPRQVPPRPALTRDDVEAASYAGSGEHKVGRWWGGLPRAHLGPDGTASRPGRQDTTICHMTTEADRAQATDWVRAALAEGRYRFYEGDKTYPKHIWHRDASGAYWFGFCVNGISGSYKGWPVEEAEKREVFG